MSITKELREWANDNTTQQLILSNPPKHVLSVTLEDARAIADRIDAAHDKALIDMRNRAINQGFDEGFASADDWCAQHEDAMAEHGWYRALDADEKPISIGDAVEHNGVVANVLGITFHGTTPPTVCICRGDCWVEADELHHHASTVEDVLREFAADFVGCANSVNDHEVTDAIELFAPKLRLAGEAE